MDLRATRRRSWPGVLAVAAASLMLGGCLGPSAVRSTRVGYNEAIRVTNDEQLLLNLVRLRYADSPIFVDLPNITSQFEISGLGGYNGGYGNQFPGTASLGMGQFTYRDTPTLSYHPREGREIAKALLNPLSVDLFSVVSAGARTDQLFWLAINDINDVPNATQATLLTPRVPDGNALFLRGVRLLAEVDDRGGAEIGFSTEENDEETSDPVAVDKVGGHELIEAAKAGYVFRADGRGQVALRKRERELTLKIRSGFTRSPEMEEMAEIFRLRPGLARYKIKSELQPNAESSPLRPLPTTGDTLYLNLRSVLQIMTFLSKGVCVPEEHARAGIAPMTPGPDGRPFDWTTVTAGNFFVASCPKRPRDAEVAVPYRGQWFYIRKDDVDSRSVLAILEILFALQESDEKAAGPVLTLPTGG